MYSTNCVRLAGALKTCLVATALVGFAPLAQAAPIEVVFSESDPTTIIGSNSLTQMSNGVTLTMRGYQVEIAPSGDETVFGPAPTSNGREIFNYDPRNLGEPGIGFVALPSPGFAITASDLPGGGLIIPGFDTVSFGNLSTIEWMEITFSQAVDVSFIDVDDTSNFNRNIWAVGKNGAFDYSSGLTDAITGEQTVNSQDDASDGPFRHNFSPFLDITSLLIGSPPGFDLAGIAGQPVGAQFFITGLGFEISDTSGGGGDTGGGDTGGDPGNDPISVPEPGTLSVFGLGLAGFALASRRRRKKA